MSADPSLELQKAMRTRAQADVTLLSLKGGAVDYFDSVPHGPRPKLSNGRDRPYIVHQEPQTQSWDTSASADDTGHGKEHSVQLSTWSDYSGLKEARQISNRLYELFHDEDSELTLTDHNLVILQYTFDDVVEEPGGQEVQSLIQFRAVTERN